MILNTKEMLTALLISGNDLCSAIAKRILEKESTIEEEKQFCGSFMTDVLEGRFDDAIMRADRENAQAFLTYIRLHR